LAAILGVLVAGCQYQGSSYRTLVSVINRSEVDATFTWPGGTEPVAACDVYARAFNDGTYPVVIQSGDDREEVTLHVTSSTPRGTWYVIDADGMIEPAPIGPTLVPGESQCR
jgi:hypothetical protein